MKVDFVGELNDKMKGFYRSKYTAPTGEVRYAAVTQFEVSESNGMFGEFERVAQPAACCITRGPWRSCDLLVGWLGWVGENVSYR